MNTDNTFFANVWIYIEDLSPTDYDHLQSINNTKFKYDEVVAFGSVSDLLNGHARRIDFMAYGNTEGWIDPNQPENNQVYTIFESNLEKGRAREGTGTDQTFARFFQADYTMIGYFDRAGGDIQVPDVGATQ